MTGITPEIQSLIDILHEDVRDDAWQQRVAQAYDTAIAPALAGDALPTDRAVAQTALQEILRQRVADEILDDVMSAAENGQGIDFARTLREKAARWERTGLAARSEDEVSVRPRQLDAQFNALDADKVQSLLNAVIDGDFTMIFAILLGLGNLRSMTPDPAAAETGTPSATPLTPRQEGVDFTVNRNANLTPEGEDLFRYFKDILGEGNAQVVYGEKLVQDDERFMGFRTNSLTPTEMSQLYRDTIARDIREGTFPIGDYSPDQAEAIAEQMTAILNTYTLDRIVPRSGVDYYGENTVTFNPSDYDFRHAIDVMMSPGALGAPRVEGATPDAASPSPAIVENNYRPFLSAQDFGNAYVAGIERHSASMDAEDLVNYFKAQIEGYESRGHQIPPTLDLPEHLRGAFYDKIREAFAESARPNQYGEFNRDSDLFGRLMAEEFGIINATGIVQPRRDDIFDHAAPVSAVLGDDLNVTAPDGRTLFSFEGPTPDFSLYGARVDGEGRFYMEEAAHISGLDDLRNIFGETFEISIASKPDHDLDESNTEMSGYFVRTSSGNTFYIGFDAIPEENITSDFREMRAQDLDTQSAEPALAAGSYMIEQKAGPPVGIPRTGN